jgi:Protein of unknown function (DUF4245)
MTDIELSKLSDEERAKKRRAKQTQNNLILSLLACLGMVAVIVLAVPRPTTSLIPHIDYKTVASQAASTSGLPILAPKLPSAKWYSNAARFSAKPSDGVASWYVGFVGPKQEYLGLTQGFDANPTWTMLQLQGDISSGTVTIAGTKWVIWQTITKNDPPKSRDYALVTDIPAKGDAPAQQLIVFGSASKSQLRSFAQSVAEAVK